TEWILRSGRALGLLHPQQQQTLVAAIGKRVDGLGHHRAGTGKECGHSLGDREREVGTKCEEDRAGRITTTGHAGIPESVSGASLPPACEFPVVMEHGNWRGRERGMKASFTFGMPLSGP